MEQLSREEFLRQFGPGGLTPAEQRARREQSGGRDTRQRRNGGFEPDPREYRGERRPVSPAVSEQMAAKAALADIEDRENVARAAAMAEGERGVVAGGFTFGDRGTYTPLAPSQRRGGAPQGRTAKARQLGAQQALAAELLNVDPSLGDMDPASGQMLVQRGQLALNEALGLPLSSVPDAALTRRTGEYMDVLGLDARSALALAQQEAQAVAANPDRPARQLAELQDYMRERDLFRTAEAATEMRPEALGRAVASDGAGAASVIGELLSDDPAQVAAREGFRQLTKAETAAEAYRMGGMRKIGGRRNPFMKEPAAVGEIEPAGVPLLTGETYEQRSAREEDGKYRPMFEPERGPDGSFVLDAAGRPVMRPVMQVPQEFARVLNSDYNNALRETLVVALYGNPAAPEVQAARQRLRQLQANPQYARKKDGSPATEKRPDLAAAALQVINPTAVARSPEAVRRVPDTESKALIGTYGGIGSTIQPDVLQGEHGFRDIDDPFTDKALYDKQLTPAQYADQLGAEYATPLVTFQLDDNRDAVGTANMEPVYTSWPRSDSSPVIGPRGAVPNLVAVPQSDGRSQLWLVSQSRLPDEQQPGFGLADVTSGDYPTLYEHRLLKPVTPLPGGPRVNRDGRLVQEFRVGDVDGQGQPVKSYMMTTEGWKAFNDFVAYEAAAQGLQSTDPSDPAGGVRRIESLSSQPVGSADIGALDYRLLVDSGALDPNPRGQIVGEFPFTPVTREAAKPVNPLNNQLYNQFKAMRAQAGLRGDPGLPVFAPPGSEEVRGYMADILPYISAKLAERTKAMKAIGRGSGSSDVSKAGLRPTYNAFAGMDQVARAEGVRLPASVPAYVRDNLIRTGHLNPETGVLSQGGLNWLKSAGRKFLPEALAASTAAPAPAGSGGWMEGESYPRVPVAPMPRGDAPMHLSANDAMEWRRQQQEAGVFQPSQPAARVTAMPPLDPGKIPEVSYVPTNDGLYVITEEGTTLHAPASRPSTAAAAPAQEAAGFLAGEQLADYVQQVRSRLAQERALRRR